jgi:endonuclease YncB( thermonuclease family)
MLKFAINPAEILRGSFRETTMKRIGLAVSLFLIAVLPVAGPSMAADLHGMGQAIVDGEEFTLCDKGECVRIRLCGVDAPSSGQVGFGESISALTKLVINQVVLCRPLGQGSVCDDYPQSQSQSRITAQCFTENGTVDVAASLVTAGLECDRTDRSGGYYSKDHPEWKCQQ